MATKVKRKDKPIRIEPTDWEAVEKRAHEIYDSIKQELEKKHMGKTCVVDGKSGDYFIGEDLLDTLKKGRKKHPFGAFSIFRIGRKVYGKL